MYAGQDTRKEDMVSICQTEYSNYANNYNNCTKYEIEGCEGCAWYVHKKVLQKFEEMTKKLQECEQENIRLQLEGLK
ncbi:unnamed protein product [marine sediment metagenome]|uniref:Uncharacterized protein n=1 Tax=marine sediment metagenome TaxID=412755 RepID=X1G5Q4_9ZZZZ